MNILINGQNPSVAIAQEALKQIMELNPNIRTEDYKDLKDIPGFTEIMQKPRGLSLSKKDEKLYTAVRRKMSRTQRLHKTAQIDFRTSPDGTKTVAAVYKGKLLWEEIIDWDVFIER